MSDLSIIRDLDKRAEYIAGLRLLADALEQNPDVKLPYHGNGAELLVILNAVDDQRAQLQAWSRVLPGLKRKGVRGDAYFDLHGAFRGLGIQVIADRDEVCERIVTGTHVETEEIPDPDYMVTVPIITREKVVEDVQWVCKPILADVAEAALNPDSPSLPDGVEGHPIVGART